MEGIPQVHYSREKLARRTRTVLPGLPKDLTMEILVADGGGHLLDLLEIRLGNSQVPNTVSQVSKTTAWGTKICSGGIEDRLSSRIFQWEAVHS